MPTYIYENPRTGEIKEVFQKICEPHTYSDSNGLMWNRVFTKPNAAVDTRISSINPNEFVSKTRGKNYSVGQLWDMSAELSEKRGGMTGQDEVREKAEQAYVAKTGKPHPHSKKKKSKFEF